MRNPRPASRVILACLALGGAWAASAPASAAVGAARFEFPAPDFARTPDVHALMLADEAAPPAQPAPQAPLSGDLVVPGSGDADDAKGDSDKKCMTVCQRWGEECILINKGTGGMQRKCRRTCQEFGEECL